MASDTPMTDLSKLAAGLSAAQRAWLTVRAEFRSPAPGYERRWMTFPPRNTHAVLSRLGLIDGVGQIRDLGLALRTHLEGQK